MDLDNDLGGLEGHIADADEAPDALVEDGGHLVDHERRERGCDGDEVAALVLRVPREEEHRGPRHGDEGEKRRELRRRLEEHAGQKADGDGEAVVPQRMAGKPDGRRARDGHGQQHKEARVRKERQTVLTSTSKARPGRPQGRPAGRDRA